MNMQEIAELAEKYGEWDDFGRWTFRDDDRLLWFALAIQELVRGGNEGPKCKDHLDAPHGFDRNASHSADRYVCECEGWEPEKK
jgi:hypothetical protein